MLPLRRKDMNSMGTFGLKDCEISGGRLFFSGIRSEVKPLQSQRTGSELQPAAGFRNGSGELSADDPESIWRQASLCIYITP
ncbi:hypothetical protein EYF80_062412 [Liparis tanakae]|uniref:Uncharacterized protein n=1 Tax=Liparis tanakae TaxID=230148 RepID=A0A4Z2EG45_9TELE|nr:hypothetical protein EYF80_062412 [Liparis tanakae]